MGTRPSYQSDLTDTVNGKIRVKLNSYTNGHAGSNRVFELRVDFSDGSYVTAESGMFNVLQSQVDRA